jgi:hypothetical protein
MVESIGLTVSDAAKETAPAARPASKKQRGWRRSAGLGLLTLAALAGGFLLAQGLPLSRGEQKKSSTGEVFALLQVLRQQPWLMSDLQVQSKAAPEDFAAYVQLQATLIKSRPILTAAVRRRGVRELEILRQKTDPAAWLEANLRVVHQLSPEILRVSLPGNQTEIATILNSVIDAYLDEVTNAVRNEQLSQLNELENALTKRSAELRDQHEQLRHLENTLQVMAPFEVSAKQQQLSDYAREATRVQIALIGASAQMNYPPEKKIAAEKQTPQAEAMRRKLREEIHVLTERGRRLEEVISKIRGDLRRSAEAPFELELRKDELEISRTVAKKLRTAIEALKIEVSSSIPRIRVLQRAEAAAN